MLSSVEYLEILKQMQMLQLVNEYKNYSFWSLFFTIKLTNFFSMGINWVYICIYMCVCVYIYIYIYIYMCVCVCVYIYIYICVCVCVYIYIYICACVYICMYVCMYIRLEALVVYGYDFRKWTESYQFKSWTRMIAFHIALISLGKVRIQLFYLQLWVNIYIY